MIDSAIIDVEEAKGRVDGEREFYLELCTELLADSVRYRDTIRAALGASDFVTVYTTAHTLKGALANLAAKKATATAKFIETQGRTSQAEGIVEALATLDADLDEFQRAVSILATAPSW